MHFDEESINAHGSSGTGQRLNETGLSTAGTSGRAG
jgi:hypothetical protein